MLDKVHLCFSCSLFSLMQTQTCIQTVRRSVWIMHELKAWAVASVINRAASQKPVFWDFTPYIQSIARRKPRIKTYPAMFVSWVEHYYMAPAAGLLVVGRMPTPSNGNENILMHMLQYFFYPICLDASIWVLCIDTATAYVALRVLEPLKGKSYKDAPKRCTNRCSFAKCNVIHFK